MKLNITLIVGVVIELLIPRNWWQAEAYDLKSLSAQDILVIGRGLDKLPREETNANDLYVRIQKQLTEQDQATAKARADAETKANEKARAEIEREIRTKAGADKVPKAEPSKPGDTP